MTRQQIGKNLKKITQIGDELGQKSHLKIKIDKYEDIEHQY
jgi:hypothetical protein